MTIPNRMTKRRREVLYHVAFGSMHGSRWRGQMLTFGHQQHFKFQLDGVDVTAIIVWLSRRKLVRLRYRLPAEMARDGYTLNRCLVVTLKGIEELLCPTM